MLRSRVPQTNIVVNTLPPAAPPIVYEVISSEPCPGAASLEETAPSAAESTMAGAISKAQLVRPNPSETRAPATSKSAETAPPERGSSPAPRATKAQTRKSQGGRGGGGGDDSPPDPSRIVVDDMRDGLPEEEVQNRFRLLAGLYKRGQVQPATF